MKATDQHKVLAILDKTIPAEGSVEWKDIVAAVGAEVKVKNWLDVRGILQYMMSQKTVVRLPSVHTEAYSKA